MTQTNFTFLEKEFPILCVNIESATIFIIDCLHSTPKFETTGNYIIDTTCIKPFEIDFNKARKVNEDDCLKWIQRLKPKKGDVLFSREGTIGLAVKVPKDIDLCIGQRMMLFRMGTFVLPRFAEIYFNSIKFKEEYTPHIKGITSQHLNIGSTRKLNFPIPTINEQKEIVKRVDNLFSKADQIQQRCEALVEQVKTLPQAIYKKYLMENW